VWVVGVLWRGGGLDLVVVVILDCLNCGDWRGEEGFGNCSGIGYCAEGGVCGGEGGRLVFGFVGWCRRGGVLCWGGGGGVGCL